MTVVGWVTPIESETMKNIYFVILARSHNDACAIAEAHKLAKVGGPNYGSVEVRVCGTKELIAHVLPDGTVGLAGNSKVFDAAFGAAMPDDERNAMGS